MFEEDSKPETCPFLLWQLFFASIWKLPAGTGISGNDHQFQFAKLLSPYFIQVEDST